MRQQPASDARQRGPDHRDRVLEARIRDKIADYDAYDFTVNESRTLNIFFDLAQEFEDLDYLHHLPVKILELFFPVRAVLYAKGTDDVYSARTPLPENAPSSPSPDALLSGCCRSGQGWYFPVFGRPDMAGPELQADEREGGRETLAILAVLPRAALNEHEVLFYQKFANRLGFALHNRMLAVKNREHIEFVRTLVHDIGHNVIVPSLHFKLLMRQMGRKLDVLRQLGDETVSDEKTRGLKELCGQIDGQFQQISKHFQQSSFFLETLLRQSHFEQGRYVLQRTEADLVDRIFQPQVERYLERFAERSIEVAVDWQQGLPLSVNADVGLLSQVLANYLSNAVKYTRVNPGGNVLRVKCSALLARDYFGRGNHGVRAEVLSSGQPIGEEEAGQLFTESFRASNTGDEMGTGHGLYFSRLIVQQHGGDCGYRRDRNGNVFYLTLPLLAAEEDVAAPAPDVEARPDAPAHPRIWSAKKAGSPA